MKLLKIKSYFIGFIVVIITLFSFNNNTYAYEVENYYFNSEEFIISRAELLENKDIINKLNDLIDFINDSNIGYDFILNVEFYEDKYISIFVTFFQDINQIKQLVLNNYNSYLELSMTNYNSGIYTNQIFEFYKSLSTSNFDDIFSSLKSKITDFQSNPRFSDYYSVNNILRYDENNYLNYTNQYPIYSSFDMNLEIDESINNAKIIFDNGFIFEESKTLQDFINEISYLDMSKIKLTKTFTNDLEGNDLYNIRADFEDIYDETYTYQFKSDYSNWIDITENIQAAAQEGYYIYDYLCRYNTNIYFRVLNNSGEVLDENSINVSELNNFGMQISHNFATDLEGRDIYSITIDLRNCWENNYKYQYSYDNKNFYNMDVSEENKIYYLNHGINIPIYFQILDSNNNILWNTKYNGPFDNINKNIELKEFTGTDQSGNKFIGFEADLSDYTQFSDIYNFKVIINGIQQDLKDVIAWNIRENQFDNYNIDFELYLDELLIEKFNYNPKLVFDSFDDKYNDIVNNEMEEEINNGDYTSIDGIFEAVKSFINAISDFINSFFKLIMVFFNRLNLWIKSAVIGIFIVMVVCRIIKAVRK